MSDEIVNINEFNKTVSNTIRIDTNRTFYAVTDDELELIKNLGSSLWENICLTALGICLPCAINAYCSYKLDAANFIQKDYADTFYLNSLGASITLGIAVIAGIAWRINHKSFKILTGRIKVRKPFNL